LNHRDPPRCAAAAHALARLGDPRTARAAAALATNELRVAYALHPVRLLTALRAPEAVPALVTTLRRRLRPQDPHHRGSASAPRPSTHARATRWWGSWGRRRRRRVVTRANWPTRVPNPS